MDNKIDICSHETFDGEPSLLELPGDKWQCFKCDKIWDKMIDDKMIDEIKDVVGLFMNHSENMNFNSETRIMAFTAAMIINDILGEFKYIKNE